MPFRIIQQDITCLPCDVLVNPTDPCFSGSGGTDLAVHTAAGEAMDAVCRRLPPLQTGSIAVTEGFRLPVRYVFHTVGPVWQGGTQNEETLLRCCYVNSLLKAKTMGLDSIAFPLISSGSFGFPKDKVLRIAIDAVSDFLMTTEGEMTVFICVFDRQSYTLSREFALRDYIGDAVPQVPYPGQDAPLMYCMESPEEYAEAENPCKNMVSVGAPPRPRFKKSREDAVPAKCEAAPTPPKDLAQWLKRQDDSFAVTLLKLIDKKGMTEVQCYKKANVSKGTFWKINNDPKYKPSRETVIAFAIALELTLDETYQLLKTVGFTLSDSTVFDRIIIFYIMNGNYDIFEINAALFRYDQTPLGC